MIFATFSHPANSAKIYVVNSKNWVPSLLKKCLRGTGIVNSQIALPVVPKNKLSAQNISNKFSSDYVTERQKAKAVRKFRGDSNVRVEKKPLDKRNLCLSQSFSICLDPWNALLASTKTEVYMESEEACAAWKLAKHSHCPRSVLTVSYGSRVNFSSITSNSPGKSFRVHAYLNKLLF